MRQTCCASHNFVECYEDFKKNILISGQALPQTLNAPTHNGVIEYQITPRIGQYAGSGIT